MTSAAEAETQTVYHNGKIVIPIRKTLQEMGHPQPPTPIKTDNSTACGILNSSMRQKRSKAFDMKIYFMKDRIKQKKSDYIGTKVQITWLTTSSNILLHPITNT